MGWGNGDAYPSTLWWLWKFSFCVTSNDIDKLAFFYISTREGEYGIEGLGQFVVHRW